VKGALYEGRVWHRRHRPRDRAFDYRLFWLYMDLDELPELFDPYWMWSARGPAPAWFRRADHLYPDGIPLAEAVRSRVSERTGTRPEGDIHLLTGLRYWGYCFNPVSFYFCSGGSCPVLLAEVHNTPWHERYTYVLPLGEGRGGRRVATFEKMFHVSPFLPMDLEYRLDVSPFPPGETLRLGIRARRGEEPWLDARLSMQRRPLRSGTLAAALFRHPWMSLKVIGAIYLEALKSWWAGFPFYPHPDRRSSA